MRKLMQAGLSVALVHVVAGCGTLFNSGPAKMTFTSSPAGAEVWVNGMRQGTTPRRGDRVVVRADHQHRARHAGSDG